MTWSLPVAWRPSSWLLALLVCFAQLRGGTPIWCMHSFCPTMFGSVGQCAGMKSRVQDCSEVVNPSSNVLGTTRKGNPYNVCLKKHYQYDINPGQGVSTKQWIYYCASDNVNDDYLFFCSKGRHPSFGKAWQPDGYEVVDIPQAASLIAAGMKETSTFHCCTGDDLDNTTACNAPPPSPEPMPAPEPFPEPAPAPAPEPEPTARPTAAPTPPPTNQPTTAPTRRPTLYFSKSGAQVDDAGGFGVVIWVIVGFVLVLVLALLGFCCVWGRRAKGSGKVAPNETSGGRAGARKKKEKQQKKLSAKERAREQKQKAKAARRDRGRGGGGSSDSDDSSSEGERYQDDVDEESEDLDDAPCTAPPGGGSRSHDSDDELGPAVTSGSGAHTALGDTSPVPGAIQSVEEEALTTPVFNIANLRVKRRNSLKAAVSFTAAHSRAKDPAEQIALVLRCGWEQGHKETVCRVKRRTKLRKVISKYATHMQVDPAAVYCKDVQSGRPLPLGESAYELDLDDGAVIECLI